LGVYWQLMSGLTQVPFPFNIILAPQRVVEWVLQIISNTRIPRRSLPSSLPRVASQSASASASARSASASWVASHNARD